MIILCDIDGTAANVEHRLHFVHKRSKYTVPPIDWDGFFAAMDGDTPNGWCQELLLSLYRNGHEIHFVSGRPDSYRKQTTDWLTEHYGYLKITELHMRPDGDRRPDREIKEEIYDKYYASRHDQILLAVDDRQQAVDAWRSRGVVVLQCAKGNF